MDSINIHLSCRGWRPSYRNVLLGVRVKLDVSCSTNLSTEDLEAEIFLHLLQQSTRWLSYSFYIIYIHLFLLSMLPVIRWIGNHFCIYPFWRNVFNSFLVWRNVLFSLPFFSFFVYSCFVKQLSIIKIFLLGCHNRVPGTINSLSTQTMWIIRCQIQKFGLLLSN